MFDMPCGTCRTAGGTWNFTAGIIQKDERRTAQAVPPLFSSIGTLSMLKGMGRTPMGLTLETESKVIGISNVVNKESNIALGVSEYLDDFARNVNGSTWKTWGRGDFQSQFLETINNPANTIHFNLEGVASPWGAVSEGSKGFGVSRATSWELYQLYSNPAALQRTIFYQGGKVVPSPF